SPGNPAFGVVCGQTPAGAITLWGLSAGVLPVGVPVLGVDIWIDPTGLVTATSIADALGAARINVPIGPAVPLGVSFSAQCLVLDPACAVDLFTASNAGTFIVQ
ncbi:MAG: hypothetical protein KDC48_21625, partial [Planctomycetes bacterium]|nr:hypothetical protein [Planctomycetota bacterium]